MYSYHSSVNAGSTNINTTVSPTKRSDISISLNGLFGELTALDEPLLTSFPAQSPPCGSSSLKGFHASPSKAQNTALNGCQQPLLLSEITEYPLNDENCGRFCCFTTTQDNRRCTNLAVTTNQLGKSFCKNHLRLSTPTGCQQRDFHNWIGSDENISQNNRSSYVMPNQAIKNSTGTAQSDLIPSSGLNGAFADVRNSNQMLVNSTVSSVPKISLKTPSGASASNSCDAISNLSIPRSEAGIPVSYVPVPNSNPVTFSPVVRGKSSPIVQSVKAHHVNKPNMTKNPVSAGAFPIDRDALQAFVNFLNENQHRFTAKQQKELLNSLGVIVATVKSPNEFQTKGQPRRQHLANGPLNGDVKRTGSNSHAPVNQGHINLQLQPSKHLPNNNTMPHLNEEVHKKAPGNELPMTTTWSNLKRKGTLTNSTLNGAKKTKKNKLSNVKNSLQFLTSQELNDRVVQVLASVNGVSSTNDKKEEGKLLDLKHLRPELIKKKSNQLRQQENLPSVDVFMNSNEHCESLRSQTFVEPLQQYVHLQIDDKLRSHNLFPLGPFCDDDDFDFCTCNSKKCQLRPVMKSSLKKKLSYTKCPRCAKKSEEHLILNYYREDSRIFHNALNAVNRNRRITCDSFQNITEISESNPSSDLSDHTLPSLKRSSPTVARLHKSIKQSKNRWKNLLRKEKMQIKLLVEAAKSDMKNTTKVLRSLGTKPLTCTRRSPVCSLMPELCALTDRLGEQKCSKRTLPFTPYCRDHIWHCSRQQLYKLGTGMNVVADITFDLASVKHRKKTKHPPLSKRKRRRVIRKDKSDKLTLRASPSQVQTVTEKFGNISKFETSTIKSNLNETPAVMNHNFMDSNVNCSQLDHKVSSNLSVEPLVNNSLQDTLPSVVDDDSNPGIFDAFSIDECNLLDDVMPDMFSEFNLFSGKTSEVLDNALQLASCVDPDNPNKLDMDDKLPFDELNDSGLLFPILPNGPDNGDVMLSEALNVGIIDQQLATTSGLLPKVSTSMRTSSVDNSSIIGETTQAFSNMSATSCQSTCSTVPSTGNVPTTLPSNSSFVGSPKWIPHSTQKNYSSRPNLITDTAYGFDKISSSFDPSFVEDLNEIEGVIQSLQDESKRNDSNSGVLNSSFKSDNLIARGMPMEAEAKISTNDSQMILPSDSTLPWSNQQNLQTSLVEKVGRSSTLVHPSSHVISYTEPLQSQGSFPYSSAAEVCNINQSEVKSPAARSSTTAVIPIPVVNKKPRNRTLGKKRLNNNVGRPSMAMDQLLPSLSGHSFNTDSSASSITQSTSSVCLDTRKKSTSCTSVAVSTSKRISFENCPKPKGGKKSRYSMPLPNFVPASTQSMIALPQSTIRLQPRLVTGNILCTRRINNTVNNQSMILIPVSAVVRSTNPTTIQRGSQGLGIAFAVPTRPNSTNATMVPVRVPPSGVNNGQQFFVLGGKKTSNQPSNGSNIMQSNQNHLTIPVTSSKPLKPDLSQLNQPPNASTTNTINMATNQQRLIFATSCKAQPVQSKFILQANTNAMPNVTWETKKQDSSLSSQTVPLTLHNSNVLQMSSGTSSKFNMGKVIKASTVDEVPLIKVLPSGEANTIQWNQSTPFSNVISTTSAQSSAVGQTWNVPRTHHSTLLPNNAQHVIVGRLGSLGRVGLSKMTISEQSKKLESLPSMNAVKIPMKPQNSSNVSTINLQAYGNKVSSPSVDVHNSFLSSTTQPLPSNSPALITSTIDASNTKYQTPVSFSQALGKLNPVEAYLTLNTKANEKFIRGCKGEAVMNEEDSVLKTEDNPSRYYNLSSSTDANALLKSFNYTAARHNSRKSDHSLTLEDPDICDSPVKLHTNSTHATSTQSNGGLSAGKSNVSGKLTNGFGNKRVIINENITQATDKSRETFLNNSKGSCKAAILRKR